MPGFRPFSAQVPTIINTLSNKSMISNVTAGIYSNPKHLCHNYKTSYIDAKIWLWRVIEGPLILTSK